MFTGDVRPAGRAGPAPKEVGAASRGRGRERAARGGLVAQLVSSAAGAPRLSRSQRTKAIAGRGRCRPRRRYRRR
jgi:hypothetical protein